ncbi:DinB family protein [soil metagenome]
MDYQNISEIYAANDKIREKLKTTVGNLTDEQLNLLAEKGDWTIQNIIEHIAIVQEGMTRISAKLLTEAKAVGAAANGTAKISDEFSQKSVTARTLKFDAPDRVRPLGTQTIAESLVKLDETRKSLEDLRPMFESVECSDFKFPHPFFGDLTAHEWLALVGGHEFRHITQIEKILSENA